MGNLFEQWFNIPNSTLRGISEIGITTHWIILQFSIGLLTLAVTMEYFAYRREDKDLMKLARTLSKVAIVIFAVGSATGSLSEFGLLLFWPNFLELVGKYYFIPLYLEVFAFFAEVVFVYFYYYTWERVSRRFHLTLGIFAVLGAFASGLLIMSVNTAMSYPPGIIETYDALSGTWIEPEFLLYLPEGGSQIFTSSQLRALISTDVSRYQSILDATVKEAGVFSFVFQAPGALVSGIHAILSGIAVTIFTIIGTYSWRFARVVNEQLKEYYFKSIKLLAWFGGGVLALQGIIGHSVAENLAIYNPEKLSALEGNSNTIFSFTDITFIRQILSFLAYGDPHAIILPYESIPTDFQVPLILHYFYYSKLIIAGLLFVSVCFIILFGYGYRFLPKALLRFNYTAPFLIQIVSNFGWITREVGRKPWTIYGVQTVAEAGRDTPLPGIYTALVIVYSLAMLIGLVYMVTKFFRIDEEKEIKDKVPEEMTEIEV